MGLHFFGALIDFLLPAAGEVRAARSATAGDLRRKAAPRMVPCGETRALALLPYRDPLVKSVLWAMKYRGSEHAAGLLAAVLAEALGEEWADGELEVAPQRIVLVPRSAESLARYGSNHLERVARALPEPYRSAVLPRALIRDKAAIRQTTLARGERLANMRGAFAIGADQEAVAGARVIVVDDVATTGATLAEAHRAVRDAGAHDVSLVALAYS